MPSTIEILNAQASRLEEVFERDYGDCADAIGAAIEHLWFVLSNGNVLEHRRYISAGAYGGRILQHGFAIYRLLRIGDVASAEVILRSALEAAFAVGALSNPSNFIEGKDFYLRLLYKSKSAARTALKNFLDAKGAPNGDVAAVLAGRSRALELELSELKKISTR